MTVISYYTVNNKKKTVSFKNGAFLVRKIPYYFGVLFGSLDQGQYSPITERLICPSGWKECQTGLEQAFYRSV